MFTTAAALGESGWLETAVEGEVTATNWGAEVSVASSWAGCWGRLGRPGEDAELVTGDSLCGDCSGLGSVETSKDAGTGTSSLGDAWGPELLPEDEVLLDLLGRSGVCWCCSLGEDEALELAEADKLESRLCRD